MFKNNPSHNIVTDLLDIGAVDINVENPFTWASGIKSPVYCDNRKVLSYPNIREFIKNELISVTTELFNEVDMIVGVATAGIPWASMVADNLNLPLLYVRSKPKEHGKQSQIEGDPVAGANVVVIEDLISTGKSSAEVVKVLQQENMNVLGLISIFNYDLEAAKRLWNELQIKVYSLAGYTALRDIIERRSMLDNDALEKLENWRLNIENW